MTPWQKRMNHEVYVRSKTPAELGIPPMPAPPVRRYMCDACNHQAAEMPLCRQCGERRVCESCNEQRCNKCSGLEES